MQAVMLQALRHEALAFGPGSQSLSVTVRVDTNASDVVPAYAASTTAIGEH